MTTTTETGERWKADVAMYIDALADDVRTKAAEIERLRKQNDALESESTDLLDERDRYERLLNQFAYTIAPQEVIGEHSSGNDPWENALDMLTPSAQVAALELKVVRVLELHSPYKIYDECGHEHEETDKGVTNVIEIGPVCKDGYMYTICRHCCTDAMGDQTEECVGEHDHSTGICETRRVLDGAEVTV